jgi:hypothetical protein
MYLLSTICLRVLLLKVGSPDDEEPKDLETEQEDCLKRGESDSILRR